MIDKYRYNKRREYTEKKGLTGKTIELKTDESKSVLELLEDKQIRKIIMECIDELRDDYKDILILTLEDLPLTDIAEKLGIGYDTLKSRKLYAIRDLRKMLIKRGVIKKEDLFKKAA